MNKNRDIILGILVGVAAFAAVFAAGFLRPFVSPVAVVPVAAAAEPADAPLTAAGSFSWLTGKIFDNPNYRLDYDDVFAKGYYENLYLLAFQKLLVEPEDTALKEVAQQYGLTLSEANAVRLGSVEPLLKAGKGLGPNPTQQQIINMANKLQADFADMYELYSLQQELNVANAASEIFSNGDVLDSGFDLINDLTVIEQLLFMETTDTTVGKPLTWGQEKQSEDTVPYYLEEEESFPAISEIYYGLKLLDKGDEEGLACPTCSEASPAAPAASAASLVEILDKDVCPEEESSLDSALGAYEEEAKDYFAEEEGAAAGSGSGFGGGGEGEEIEKEEKLLPAVPDDWYRTLYCDGPLWTALYGSAESSESEIDKGVPISSAVYYMCLETKSIWETYSSFVPVDNCINCELEKILAYMKKTLSHSLLPNKVTGNYMETAKCKSSIAVPWIDVQFIQIWAPILTPPHDDAIYGKSITKEWDKFIKRENPFALRTIWPAVGNSLLFEHITQTATDIAAANVLPDTELATLLNEISAIEAQLSKQMAEGVEEFDMASPGEDFVVYSQSVLAEIKQMTAYFKNFMDMFKQIATKSCPVIINKEYID